MIRKSTGKPMSRKIGTISELAYAIVIPKGDTCHPALPLQSSVYVRRYVRILCDCNCKRCPFA